MNRNTVIEAEIEYSIEQNEPGQRFYVAPVFAGTRAGTTFNASPMADMPQAKPPHGIIHLRYPLGAVWDSPQLAKPIRVIFILNQYTGPRSSISIAMSAPYIFEPAK